MIFGIEKNEYLKLNKSERNGYIVNFIKEVMRERGYEGKLIFQPIENGYQEWGRKYPPAKNGVPVFAKFLWEINGDEQYDTIEVECSNLVVEAASHYGLI